MDSPITLLTLFILGFFGGTHCIGMCGGLSSAFALQLPPHIGRIQLILLLNIGRLSSYVAIGALMGALSQIGSVLQHTHEVQKILLVLANILLLFMGLYLAGVFNGAAKIDLIGKPIWRKLNPFLNKLLPIQSVKACFLVGVLWGWLPCGLVYNAALYALGSGSAGQGALYLLAFGLGTLPNLLAMGVFAAQLKSVLHHRMIRLGAGLLVSAWAIWQLSSVFQAA
ncbi:sulfite exporter TauE/SafE family protein [Neisseriaceae bacterium B1]